jgi:hypothetical protein
MSTAKFDTLSTLDGSQSVPVGTVAQGTARAWVNFNGTGTVAIRAAFNVTSITDNGTGDYTLNFTTAMLDANYVPMLQNTGYLSAGANYAHLGILTIRGDFSSAPTLKTTTQLRIASGLSYSASLRDSTECNVAIFR